MDAQLLPCRGGEMRLERGVISPRLWSTGQSQGCLADSNTRLPSIVEQGLCSKRWAYCDTPRLPTASGPSCSWVWAGPEVNHQSQLFSVYAWKAKGRGKLTPGIQGEERSGEDGVVSWLMRAPPSGLTPPSRAVAVTPQAPTQAPCRCLSSLFRGPSLTKLSSSPRLGWWWFSH